MRKINILEVLDPIKNEFVPIRQAINQGLFSTKTYLFFNPKENRHYSITEAAQRGIFKSAIDLRPEALIVERVKIAETVSLISARDPANQNKLIHIVDAIKKGIVDTNLRIYRNPNTNEVIDLAEAIDNDLVQVKIVRETTEKITETLTEQKNPENLGIIKKIDRTSSSTNTEVDFDDEESDRSKIKQINGLYVYDRTKSFNVNKRLKKYEDDVAAGFISDSDSQKIINQSSKHLKSILKSESHINPIIDMNEAIQKNIVILPDSLNLTQNVEYVVDLKNGTKFDFDTACDMGIIDVRNKKFFDTRTSASISLFEALGKNYIKMKDELTNNYEDEDNNDYMKDVFAKKMTYRDISTVFNPHTGEQISMDKAILEGLYNTKQEIYIDTQTKRKFTLDEAIKKGFVVPKREKVQTEINEGFQFLHIRGIINPINHREMQLNEAITDGFLDYTECEFHDPNSPKPLTLLEAYDKGLNLKNFNTFSSKITYFYRLSTLIKFT